MDKGNNGPPRPTKEHEKIQEGLMEMLLLQQTPHNPRSWNTQFYPIMSQNTRYNTLKKLRS